MHRVYFPAIAALVVGMLVSRGLAAQDEKKEVLKVDGKFTDKDPEDRIRKGCYHKVHMIKLVEGATYQIDMIGVDKLDTYLRLEDAKGKPLDENDDVAEGNLDSRIVFKAPKTDTYRIIATTFVEGETGAYTLIVTQTAGPKEKDKDKDKDDKK
jgi:hypothetical protein